MSTAIDFEALRRKVWAFWEEDHLYPLQSESWWTGSNPDGRQLLVTFDRSNARVCSFDAEGCYLGVEVGAHGLSERKLQHFYRDEAPAFHQFLRQRFQFQDALIRIRRFESQEAGVSIRPMPSWSMRFLDTPEDYPESDQREFADSIGRWITERHTYILKWGNEYFIDSTTGECTAS